MLNIYLRVYKATSTGVFLQHTHHLRTCIIVRIDTSAQLLIECLLWINSFDVGIDVDVDVDVETYPSTMRTSGSK